MEIDSDVFTACKDKLVQFRLKELKDVLSHAGLSKQGKKQDLVDRILALLYDEGTPGLFKNKVNGKEELVEFIDDAYRKMHEPGTVDSNSKKQNGIGSSRIKPKEETGESLQLEKKIRCPCGGSAPNVDPLIQCLDPDCNIWQHSSCVIIPEKPMEKVSVPSRFLCEICRLKRADPFWVTMAHPLYPVKLASSSTPVDGTNPILCVEKSFKLTRADRDLLQKAEYDVQAWCMLFNDSVPCRVQWLQYPDLQVNGIPIRAVNRPGSQLLGANGRDDGVKITMYIVEGMNKISLSGSDARTFCLGVRLVRRRTLQQVLGLIPKEPDGEPFESALARVQRCIGGGITMGKDDSDSDLEVIADSIAVNLRCPMSGSRMKTAGRFKPCIHMGCFDLETFVELNERSKKWQCPVCLKNFSVEDLIIDPFFNCILNMMQSCGEEINEIDMKPDGFWRVRNSRDVGDLARWHHPDGSIEEFSLSEIKQENVLEGNTSKQGLQNDVAGWLDDESGGLCPAFMDQQDYAAGNYELNIITMSSTTTENGKDNGDPSINQDEGDEFGINNSIENEVSSGLLNLGQTHEIDGQVSCPAAHADVIILSDSEDDDVSLVDPETLPVVSHVNDDGFSLSTPSEILNCYPAVASGEGPGILDANSDLLKPQAPFLSNSCGIDFFGSSVAIVDDHNSASCSESVNTMLISESSSVPVHHLMDSCEPCTSSFDHGFASASGNTPLDGFQCPSVSCNELPLLNTSPGEDWISLKTSDAGLESSKSSAEVHLASGGENMLDLPNQVPLEDSLMQNTPGESGPGSDLNSNGKGSDGPFSFPRQRRTARKRAHEAAFQDLPSK